MQLLVRVILMVSLAAQALAWEGERGCAPAGESAPAKAVCGCCAASGCEMAQGCGCATNERAPAAPAKEKDRAPRAERVVAIVDGARAGSAPWGRGAIERRGGLPAVCRFEGRSIQAVLCVWLT